MPSASIRPEILGLEMLVFVAVKVPAWWISICASFKDLVLVLVLRRSSWHSHGHQHGDFILIFSSLYTRTDTCRGSNLSSHHLSLSLAV